jgi:hypothetical protein
MQQKAYDNYFPHTANYMNNSPWFSASPIFSRAQYTAIFPISSKSTPPIQLLVTDKSTCARVKYDHMNFLDYKESSKERTQWDTFTLLIHNQLWKKETMQWIGLIIVR